MNVYIDTEKWAIKHIERESPFFMGENFVSKIRIYFDSTPSWFPTLTFLKPNGRRKGPFGCDASGTYEVVIDGVTWYVFEFTISTCIGLLDCPGELLCTLSVNMVNDNGDIIGQKPFNFTNTVVKTAIYGDGNIIVMGDNPESIILDAVANLEQTNIKLKRVEENKKKIEQVEGAIPYGDRTYVKFNQLTSTNTIENLFDALVDNNYIGENNVEYKFYIELGDGTILENIHINPDETKYSITSIIRNNIAIKAYMGYMWYNSSTPTIAEFIDEHNYIVTYKDIKNLVNDETLGDVVDSLEEQIPYGDRTYHYASGITNDSSMYELIENLKSSGVFDGTNEARFYIELGDGTILDNITFEPFGGTLYNATSIYRNTKLFKGYLDTTLTISEFVLKHSEIATANTVSNALDKVSIKEEVIKENPTTFMGGKWKFKECGQYPGGNTFNVSFYDSLGNRYTELSLGGNYVSGTFSDGTHLTIYAIDSTQCLAKDSDGNILQDYYLIFEEEPSNINLHYLTHFADKYVEKTLTPKEYVDQTNKKVDRIFIDLTDILKITNTMGELINKIIEIRGGSLSQSRLFISFYNGYYYLDNITFYISGPPQSPIYSVKSILNESKYYNGTIDLTMTISEFMQAHNQFATQKYVNNLLANFSSLDLKPVDVLPTENISTSSIYLLKTDTTDETNIYEEWIYVNSRWELIGTTKVDLKDYFKITGGVVNGETEFKTPNSEEFNFKTYSDYTNFGKIATFKKAVNIDGLLYAGGQELRFGGDYLNITDNTNEHNVIMNIHKDYVNMNKVATLKEGINIDKFAYATYTPTEDNHLVPKKYVDEKAANINGGEEFITVESQETTFEILPNKYYNFGLRTTELNLTLSGIQSGVLQEFMGEIIIDEPDECIVFFPNNIRWKSDDNSVLNTDGSITLSPKFTYIFSILNNLGIISSFENESLGDVILSLNNTTLSWDAVENADGYEVYCDNELVSKTTETYIEISNYVNEIGRTYTIKVVAISSVLTDSLSTIEYTVTVQLSTPINLILNDSGVLSWDMVENATAYKIYDDNLTDKGSTIENYIDLNQKISRAGVHHICVKAFNYVDGINLSTVYLPSEYSNFVEFVRYIQLTTPINLVLTNGVLSWDSVINADTYNIYSGDTKIGSTTSTAIDLYDLLTANGTYQITIKASNSQNIYYLESTASAIMEFTKNSAGKLAAPTNLTKASSYTLSWDAVENADGYNVYYQNTGDENYTLLTKVTSTTASYSSLTSGSYNLNFVVTAIDSTGTYDESDYSNSVNAVGSVVDNPF